MAGIVKRLKLGHLAITFVVRHRWEKGEDRLLDNITLWHRRYQLGMWFKREMAVGTRKKGIALFSKANLSPSWYIGLDLIWIKLWFNFSWRVLHLKIND